ncbi:DDE-type integrase/transposase/recombinase [Myxosarcina sp. GI1(2024)]
MVLSPDIWRQLNRVVREFQVLDILIQKRNVKAGKQMMNNLLKKEQLFSRVIVTDKLQSYAAAIVYLISKQIKLPPSDLPEFPFWLVELFSS